MSRAIHADLCGTLARTEDLKGLAHAPTALNGSRMLQDEWKVDDPANLLSVVQKSADHLAQDPRRGGLGSDEGCCSTRC